MNMAATFNRTLWRKKGEVISTEMRALNNLNWHRSGNEYALIGLSGFGNLIILQYSSHKK